MCFVLYIAAPKPLPIIPWDEKKRALHTEALSEHDMGVKTHFEHQHVYYVGSDLYCGCGYRNASYQNGSWPKEEWHSEDDTSHIKAQPNHERLVQFIRQHLAEQPSIELYGMWEADFTCPTISNQTIPLDRLLALDFYFRDRGHYTVIIDKDEQDRGPNTLPGVGHG